MRSGPACWPYTANPVHSVAPQSQGEYQLPCSQYWDQKGLPLARESAPCYLVSLLFEVEIRI